MTEDVAEAPVEDTGAPPAEPACVTDDDCAGQLGVLPVCTAARCDDETATCLAVALGSGEPCDDGDPCTGTGHCFSGACAPGKGICGACGDGVCGTGETCTTCEGDCGPCPPNCGDGTCDADETCATCPGDCGGCTGACCGAGEAPGCEVITCQTCVCAEDAYCCLTSWDDWCATLAGGCGCCAEPTCGDGACDSDETCASCPTDCGACVGTCCSGRGEPGCEDPVCSGCVCGDDAFCCDVAWDEVCAGEAVGCGCCGDKGSCCEAKGSGGCEDVSCEQCVCAGDAFCCAAAWDQGCVEEAITCGCCEALCGDGACTVTESCETCDQDCGPCPPADCCTPHQGPGCEAKTCEACVCEADALCCEGIWDATCAELAEVCGCCEVAP